MNIEMNRVLKIKEKAEIMNILLFRSAKYWSRIKNIFQFPLVLTTGALVVVNSYEDTKDWVRIMNVIVNSTNVCIMGILNQFKMTEKIANLNEKATEFLELSHKIEAEMYQDDLTNERISTFQDKFDAILKNCMIEAIPDYINNQIKKEYPNKHYPLCMGILSTHSSPNPSLGGDEV